MTLTTPLKALLKSFLLVSLCVGVVMLGQFILGWQEAKQEPAFYQTETSLLTLVGKKTLSPVLIEFYTNECPTCRILTPMLHAMVQRQYPFPVTLVMIDANDPTQAQPVSLFGITEVPSLFYFDTQRMVKHRIPLTSLHPTALAQTLATELTRFDSKRQNTPTKF
jgi:thiol-disulfide isomerase/thioredoxin